MLALVVSLVAAGSSICVADQLQWNGLGVCEEAVQVIEQQSLLVSYCSLASVDHVELWLVRRAYIVRTPAEGLFEVLVLAKRLYKSQKAFSSTEFPVPADQWSFYQVRDRGWIVERIDLAYMYTYAADSSFECLGKLLGLECLVGVETISLPGNVMERASHRRIPGHLISLHSFSAFPSWRPHAGSTRAP